MGRERDERRRPRETAERWGDRERVERDRKRGSVEKLTPSARPSTVMSSSDSGLMSSAGLVRYFDAEDSNAIQIDPKTVIAFGVFIGVLVLVLNAFA
jgi:preprotein translocase subunit Sec61beta